MLINPTIVNTGGLSASIIVTAPTGSAVTCTTPGGVVLTAIEVAGTWTFANLSVLGNYTITATLGTNTKTQTVNVDRNAEFQVNIQYPLYLYNLGDECEGVTGGYTATSYMVSGWYWASAQTPTLTKNPSNMVTSITGATLSMGSIWTGKKINFSGYSNCYIDCSFSGAPGASVQPRLRIDCIENKQNNFVRPDPPVMQNYLMNYKDTAFSGVLRSRIRGSGEYYFVLTWEHEVTYSSVPVTINKIWLE